MSKPYPADVLHQMNAAIASWQAIDPTLKFGDLSLEMMQSVLEQGEALRNRINALETQLTDLRNQRDAVYQNGWKYINRLRDGISGHYGDDSSEYEMVGRTRLRTQTALEAGQTAGHGIRGRGKVKRSKV